MSLPETHKAVITNGFGKAPTYEERPVPKPGKNQVLVKTAFAPINPSDLMTIQGTYQSGLTPPHLVGFEGSGTVVALGEDLKVHHQVGDKVHIYSVGTFSQYLVADSEKLLKIQDGLSLEEAACHLINPVTVVQMGRVVEKGGHKAVIHTAGASALGRMLIRYFKHKGVKLINVVRKDEYIDELKKEGADYVLNSEAPDFEEKLKEIAHKEEATITFEAVAGELTGKVLKAQPDGSTVYVYGALASKEITKLGAPEFIFQGKTITGFLLWKYPKLSPEELLEIKKESYSLLPTILKSEIQKVFSLDDYKEALEFYNKNSSKGKILLKPN